MNIIKDVKAFYSRPFKRDTLEEIIITNTKEAIVEVAQCDHTIRSQQFIRHMAMAEIAAMEVWNHRGDAK